MKFHRLRAVFFRLVKTSLLEPSKIFDDVFWPALNIILMGLTALWVEQVNDAYGITILSMLVSGVLWECGLRPNFAVAVSIFEEITARNFVNLFATPLTLAEWMVASMFLGLCKIIFVLLLGWIVVLITFHVNIFVVGLPLIVFASQMLLFGWTLGFLSGALLVYWGHRIQSLMWAMSWLFAPFSAAFCPLNVLPKAIRCIAYCLPTTYVFEGMRLVVCLGIFPVYHVVMAYILGVFYLVIALSVFVFAFNKSKNLGLARLE